MAILEKSSKRPIFRPLLGHNKTEIIDLSKEVGTHDISIRPHDDACSLFAAKHPITRPFEKYWNEVIEKLDIQDELSKVLDEAQVYYYKRDGSCIELSEHLYDQEWPR